jgi:hypothetical protein
MYGFSHVCCGMLARSHVVVPHQARQDALEGAVAHMRRCATNSLTTFLVPFHSHCKVALWCPDHPLELRARPATTKVRDCCNTNVAAEMYSRGVHKPSMPLYNFPPTHTDEGHKGFVTQSVNSKNNATACVCMRRVALNLQRWCHQYLR